MSTTDLKKQRDRADGRVGPMRRALAVAGFLGAMLGAGTVLAPVANAEVGVSMDLACSQQRPIGYYNTYTFNNFKSPYTWQCSGRNLNGGTGTWGVNVNAYCARNYGTSAFLANNTMFGWRCR